MAYSKSKGLLAIRTTDGWQKLDSFMSTNGYTSTPDQMQDLDSYVNANGKLVRNVLSTSRTRIDFNTCYMEYSKMKNLTNIIKKGTKYNSNCSEKERKVLVRYFNDYQDEYYTAYMYIADIKFQYGGTYNGQPLYMPTSVAMIAYSNSTKEG